MSGSSGTMTVQFKKPFRIDGVERVLPAGTYCVMTEDENLPTVLSSGRVRRSTWIVLGPSSGAGGNTEMIEISATSLAAALARDADPASEAG